MTIVSKTHMTEQTFLDIVENDFEISRGHPQPLGSTILRDGINFALFSKNARSVSLVLFKPLRKKPIAEFPLDKRYNRTGDIWHIYLKGIPSNLEYGYRIDGPSENPLNRFNKEITLLDPYAKAIEPVEIKNNDGESEISYRSLIIDDEYDWGFDQPLNTPLTETIIYELHTKGFTRHGSSGVNNPGTYKGLTEKIPYLKELGITAVELLPINEFLEFDTNLKNPQTGKNLTNFWGYNTIGFFAPKASYSSLKRPGGQVDEFKEMVKAFHDAGIEVILDVVFNHTAEGNQNGQTISFRGIDNQIYYLLDKKDGSYHNYSGCGNTLNCNHPVVRDMILECLRYWVTEMHVDGFRFDLASILGRGQDGSVLADPPLLERISADPILGSTKLIAEAWDAAGLYQVGSFPSWGRWAEWNASFRDDIRKFVKGDAGVVSSIADRVIGSPDIYSKSGRVSQHSINFVTCHDGFTLNDLVSYDKKYNNANGEENRDGNDNNLSWNCGFEGDLSLSSLTNSKKKKIDILRKRQIRNFMTLNILSRGVPMLLSGDEFLRSQMGNNNAYCQDNEISWVNWNLLEKNSNLVNFMKRLIQFRKRHPGIATEEVMHADEKITFPVNWHGIKPDQPDWSYESRSLAWQISEKMTDKNNEIYIAANLYWKPLKFKLPKLEENMSWYQFIDTSKPELNTDVNSELLLKNQKYYKLNDRSILVLVGK